VNTQSASKAGTLGPETALSSPAPGAVDQAVVFGAVALLAAVLVGMTVRALRAVPEPEKAGSG
jgi:hypothetical protein